MQDIKVKIPSFSIIELLNENGTLFALLNKIYVDFKIIIIRRRQTWNVNMYL